MKKVFFSGKGHNTVACIFHSRIIPPLFLYYYEFRSLGWWLGRSKGLRPGGPRGSRDMVRLVTAGSRPPIIRRRTGSGSWGRGGPVNDEWGGGVDWWRGGLSQGCGSHCELEMRGLEMRGPGVFSDFVLAPSFFDPVLAPRSHSPRFSFRLADLRDLQRSDLRAPASGGGKQIFDRSS